MIALLAGFVIVGALYLLVMQQTNSTIDSATPANDWWSVLTQNTNYDVPGNLVILDATQIARVAANAGFQGADLITAVAIALAESGGQTEAYNPETSATGGTPMGQGSYGLWQIYLKVHGEFTGLNLYDPQTNANAAFAVYKAAGGFSPWSTYKAATGKTPAYVARISQAEQGVMSV